MKKKQDKKEIQLDNILSAFEIDSIKRVYTYSNGMTPREQLKNQIIQLFIDKNKTI